MFLPMLVACAPALTGTARDRLVLDAPSGWQVTRNHRAFGTDNVAFAKDDAAMSVLVGNDSGRAQTYPLDIVASIRALSWGRSVGVQNAVVAEHAIALDGREAYAITGLRRWRTTEIAYSMVVTRTCDRVAELVLHAPAATLDRYAGEWGKLLESVQLRESPGWIDDSGPLFQDEGWRHGRDCHRTAE